MKIRFATAAALALACTAAVAQTPPNQPGHESPRPGSNTEAVSATEDSIAGMVGRISAEMTSTTQGFVTAAATSDMYEVEAGKLAVARARSPSFGRNRLRDCMSGSRRPAERFTSAFSEGLRACNKEASPRRLVSRNRDRASFR